MMHEKNQLYRRRSGQRLEVWPMPAAPKYPSAANSVPPFVFPALSLRNALLRRIPCYLSAASLAQCFQTVGARQRSWEGEPASLALPGSALTDTHTQPQTFKSSGPTPAHIFFFSPPFNRKDDFTRNILAIGCCACWRLRTKTDAVYCQQYFYERLPWRTSASASIRSVTLTRALLYLYQLRRETAFTVRLPWKLMY